jgi:hypothetical protein
MPRWAAYGIWSIGFMLYRTFFLRAIYLIYHPNIRQPNCRHSPVVCIPLRFLRLDSIASSPH